MMIANRNQAEKLYRVIAPKGHSISLRVPGAFCNGIIFIGIAKQEESLPSVTKDNQARIPDVWVAEQHARILT